MADPTTGTGPVKMPTPVTPPPKPDPTGAVTVPIQIIDPTMAMGFFNVGAGSNPPVYAPIATLPIVGADPTKGNVAGVLGYVGPVLGSPSQGTATSITCGVFGQGSDSCPGVVGTNGPLTVKDPDAAGDGVFGFGSTNGVHGLSTNGTGVSGNSTGGDGIVGKSTTGIAVHAQSLGSGPAGKFEGSVEIDGAVTAKGNLEIDGAVTATGTITAKDMILSGADCAEEFDLYDAQSANPGTVMVIDDDGKLRQSHSAYDKRVAGVVSGGGPYKPAIVLDRHGSSEGRASLALVGKVLCKVDADPAPIAVGDLLTTSNRAGFGMKAVDSAQAFGAVIGKALKPLRAGQGEIPILVALQ